MNPFYQDDYVTLYTGDNRDLAPLIDRCDHILTDVPFDRATHEGARTSIDEALIDFDAITAAELLAYLDLWGPKVRRWCVSFMDWRHIGSTEQALTDHSLRFVRFGLWDKPNGAPQFTGDRPSTGWEAIAIMHRAGGRMRWNGGGKRAVWTAMKINGKHKTEKPQPLLEQLIRDFTNPDDLIVDPFAGSYAVAQACKRLARRCIAIELNPKYAAFGAERCATTVPLVSAMRSETAARGVQLVFGEEAA